MTTGTETHSKSKRVSPKAAFSPSKSTTLLRLMSELSLKLQALIRAENIYQEIVDLVQNKFHYYSFSIWSVSPDGTATIAAQSGAYNPYLKVGFSIKNEGIVSTVIATKKSYVCNDVSLDSHFTKLSLPVDSRAQLAIPVILDNFVTAILSIEANQANAFDEDDKLCFESLGSQMSVALTNARLYSEVNSFNKRLQGIVEARTHELRLANARVLEQQKLLQKENKALKSLVDQEVTNEGTLISASSAMGAILSLVDKIAPTNASVLVQGESGTGKELVARRLHFRSERKLQPYVTINCGALQENLLESELFGHEKGSFTGAHATKIGLCETASGGTLFLDEIGEMSLGVQAKLLRFLQEGEIYRVGGKKPIKVSVRIISATNKDLEKEVKAGRFREDLFYRLNTITLHLPPLRKRREDIRPLVEHFLENQKLGSPISKKKIDPKVFDIFESYDWPGNIRELQNTIERIKILAENHEIRVEDIPFHIRMPQTKSSTGSGPQTESHIDLSLDDLEKQHILRTLAYFNNNKTKAATSLGITIKTLYNKLHRYGLLTDKPPEEPNQVSQ